MTQTLEVTVGEIATELRRRGMGSDERVTLTIEAGRELVPGRREARARIVVAGLTDDDIDRLIQEARREANDELRRETPAPRT